MNHGQRRHGLLYQPRHGHGHCPPTPYTPPTPPPLFDVVASSKPHEEVGKPAAALEKVDYMNLPCPVPYEEV
jgi:mitochondrial import receptor subunit TOM40